MMRYAAWLLMLVVISLSFSALSLAQPPVAEKTAELVLPERSPSHGIDWTPSEEMAKLLEKMQNASKASREVFEPLSAAQMNWRPSDGSHTPRWNAEHLAATQLSFLSQAYATIDPEHHKAIKINPKQMPADYVAAHPDWTGAQEAEQMKRIDDYARGYAYLLEGYNLDKPLPGGRMPLRKLLEIIAGHYDQHTANVKKKFELADWPAK